MQLQNTFYIQRPCTFITEMPDSFGFWTAPTMVRGCATHVQVGPYVAPPLNCPSLVNISPTQLIFFAGCSGQVWKRMYKASRLKHYFQTASGAPKRHSRQVLGPILCVEFYYNPVQKPAPLTLTLVNNENRCTFFFTLVLSSLQKK